MMVGGGGRRRVDALTKLMEAMANPAGAVADLRAAAEAHDKSKAAADAAHREMRERLVDQTRRSVSLDSREVAVAQRERDAAAAEESIAGARSSLKDKETRAEEARLALLAEVTETRRQLSEEWATLRRGTDQERTQMAQAHASRQGEFDARAGEIAEAQSALDARERHLADAGAAILVREAAVTEREMSMTAIVEHARKLSK